MTAFHDSFLSLKTVVSLSSVHMVMLSVFPEDSHLSVRLLSLIRMVVGLSFLRAVVHDSCLSLKIKSSVCLISFPLEDGYPSVCLLEINLRD